METVWIAHPKLDSPAVEVPASSLPLHQRAGWEQTEAPPPPPLPDPDPAPGPDPDSDADPDADPGPDPGDTPSDQTSEAPAAAGASALPDESPRRRRTTTRGDE